MVQARLTERSQIYRERKLMVEGFNHRLGQVSSEYPIVIRRDSSKAVSCSFSYFSVEKTPTTPVPSGKAEQPEARD
jgi:hypothetical protein